MKRTTVTAIGLILLLPAAASAQVRLRFAPPAGQQTRYTMVTETWMQSPMMGGGASGDQPFSRVSAWTTQTIASVTGDTVAVRQVIDSARMEFPALPPQAAAMAGRMGDQMRGLTTVTRMTSRGRVLSTEVEQAGNMPGLQPGAVGGPQSGSNQYMAMPAGPVRPGDTWTDTSVVEDDNMSMRLIGTHRFERMEAGAAVVSITGTMRMTPSGGETTEFEYHSEYRFEPSSSRIRAMTVEMSGNAQVQGQSVPMRLRISSQAR